MTANVYVSIGILILEKLQAMNQNLALKSIYAYGIDYKKKLTA